MARERIPERNHAAYETLDRSRQRRTYNLTDFIVVSVLIIVAAGLTLVLLRGRLWPKDPPRAESTSTMTSNPTNAPTIWNPTIAPTTVQNPLITRRSEAFDALKSEYLSSTVLPESMDDLIDASDRQDSTSQEKAAEWIIFDDPLALKHTEPWFFLRYALAVLYHENAKTSAISTDSSWLSGETACTWSGITCNEGTDTITKLNLGEKNMEGSLPAEVKYLSTLEEFIVYKNGLVGRPPWTSFFKLQKLATLNLRDNTFAGNLPTEIGTMDSLTFAYLSGNEFTGTIPKEILTAENLETLELNSNEFNGTYPDLTCLVIQDFIIDCDKVLCQCCKQTNCD